MPDVGKTLIWRRTHEQNSNYRYRRLGCYPGYRLHDDGQQHAFNQHDNNDTTCCLGTGNSGTSTGYAKHPCAGNASTFHSGNASDAACSGRTVIENRTRLLIATL